MRVVKHLGLALVAVSALSAMTVPSAIAAPLFLAHPPGGLLLASTGGTKQVLKTKAGLIECTALKLLPPGDNAPAGQLWFLRILILVDYEICKAFGLAAVVHPVHYLIDANGLVTLTNDVLVLAPSCKVKIPAAKNQSLKTVKFENTPANGGILLLTEVAGVTTVGEGPLESCIYAEESNGTAEGTIHVTMHGGIIRWDP